MANEMVERVARALDAMDEHTPQGGYSSPAAWRIHARAAIKAMREPTEEMIEEGRQLMNLGDETLYPEDMREKWQAMIDVALISTERQSSDGDRTPDERTPSASA
jgi:hypothetical protein